MSDKGVWITWQDHRRSRELADALDADYVYIPYRGPRLLRYPGSAVQTVSALLRYRPRTAYCQNPSIVLAALMCFFRPMFRYYLVVDRHSNFKFEKAQSRNPKWRLFHFLSKWTVQKSDLTIVTNQALAEIVEQWGGRALVLQDRIPRMIPTKPTRTPPFMVNPDSAQVMFVTTFSADEPIDEMVAAIRSLEGVTGYITGKYEKCFSESQKKELEIDGVILTGFVSDADYVDLMNACDSVVVLTMRENLLTCGAYEALALSKPMVLSDTEALKGYFSRGAIYTSNERADLALAIKTAVIHKAKLIKEIEDFKPILESAWKDRFRDLLVDR